jgi:hypothetical protein
MRIALCWVLAFLCSAAFADKLTSTTNFFTAKTANNSTSATFALGPGPKTFQSSLTTTSGNGSATVTVYGSLDGTNFDSIGSMTPTNSSSDSISIVAATYLYYEMKISNLTGTGAAVTANGGN